MQASGGIANSPAAKRQKTGETEAANGHQPCSGIAFYVTQTRCELTVDIMAVTLLSCALCIKLKVYGLHRSQVAYI